MLIQLGFDPLEMAKNDSNYKENPISISVNSSKEIETKDLTSPEDLVYSLITNVWKHKQFTHLKNYFTEKSTLHAICNNNIRGITNIKEYVQSILNSFLEVTITIERITSNRNGNSTEIAARWYINGKTVQKGVFGVDSAHEVFIPVISHYQIEDDKIINEWMIYDGFDALCQIYK